MADADISNLKLVDALLDLHASRRSGAIRLERGKAKKQLVLMEGRLAFAESNQAEDHLATIMAGMELLAKKDLGKVASMIRAGKTSREAILSVAGVEESSLSAGRREQAISVLASMLSWKECEPVFYPGGNHGVRGGNLEMSLPELLVFAARKAAGRRLLSFPAAGPDILLYPAEDQRRLSSLPLDSLEAYAYSRVQKATRLDLLLPVLGGCAPNPGELVLRLLSLGLIRRSAHAEGAPAPLDLVEMELEAEIEELSRRFEVANHYEILGVPPDATADAIQEAYHELARKYHPDRFSSDSRRDSLREKAESLFTFVTGAYTILADAAARAAYDDVRLQKESIVDATLQARGVDLEREKMAEVLFRAGRQNIAEKDFDKAVRHLKECVWLRPEDARYHHYLAVAQSEHPQYRKEAEQHFLKALELDSLRLESHLELGKLYLKVNLKKRAEDRFLEVLRWDPDHKAARKLLESTV